MTAQVMNIYAVQLQRPVRLRYRSSLTTGAMRAVNYRARGTRTGAVSVWMDEGGFQELWCVCVCVYDCRDTLHCITTLEGCSDCKRDPESEALC